MKRRIIRLGTSTLVVSLPAKWSKKHSLVQGSEVDVMEDDGSLLIQLASSKKVRKEFTLDLQEHTRDEVRNVLSHLYRKGFEKITLRNVQPDIHTEVKHVLHLLLGFEITQREKGLLVLENLAEPTEQRFDVLVRRLFFNIKEIQAITRELPGSYSDIVDLRLQHDRFVLYCRRLLIREAPDRIHLQWELLTFLTHILHAYYYLAEHMHKSDTKVTEKLQRSLRELESCFVLYTTAYVEKDIASVHAINKLKSKLYENFFEQMKKGSDAITYSYLKEIYRMMQIGTSPILAMNLEG